MVRLAVLLLALVSLACTGQQLEGFQAAESPQQQAFRWPGDYDCGAAVILHLDAAPPGEDGSLDMAVAHENIMAAAEVLRAYPQIKITAAFPTSEWETWPMWEAAGVEFAEIVGHSHSHHAAILAAIRGPEVVGDLDGVYFDRLPDDIFDWDYGLMTRHLDAIGVRPKGYVAPNMVYSPHMLDVFREDGLTWYTTSRTQPQAHGDLVDLGWHGGPFIENCARGDAIVLHLHVYRRSEVSHELLGPLAALDGAWFVSASEMAALYLAVTAEGKVQAG